jgi:hypothetical protein
MLVLYRIICCMQRRAPLHKRRGSWRWLRRCRSCDSIWLDGGLTAQLSRFFVGFTALAVSFRESFERGLSNLLHARFRFFSFCWYCWTFHVSWQPQQNVLCFQLKQGRRGLWSNTTHKEIKMPTWSRAKLNWIEKGQTDKDKFLCASGHRT